jgi:hypothetical protein
MPLLTIQFRIAPLFKDSEAERNLAQEIFDKYGPIGWVCLKPDGLSMYDVNRSQLRLATLTIEGHDSS